MKNDNVTHVRNQQSARTQDSRLANIIQRLDLLNDVTDRVIDDIKRWNVNVPIVTKK